MSKRKDNKGRILLAGESQESNGRYRYVYTSADGRRHSIYSWRLTNSDPVHDGQRENEPLRELKKQIQKDVSDGISPKHVSLNDLFNDLIETKFGIRESTQIGYKELYERYIKTEYGHKNIASFKRSDIKKMYIKLKTERNLSGGTIRKINCILSQIFDSAVNDDLIRKNPCNGIIGELNKTAEFKPQKRSALTLEQQTDLLEYVRSSPIYGRWYPLLLFMLGTGTRVGEATGLLWRNVDFENNLISIDHSLNSVGTKFTMAETKTENSNREIPMLANVKTILYELYKQAGDPDPDDFVFLNKHGHFINRNWFNQMLKRIARDYNNLQQDKSKWLPENLSSHILRHSFITRLFENDVSAKVTQVIVGHSKVSTTLDIYTDVFGYQKKKVFEELDSLNVV